MRQRWWYRLVSEQRSREGINGLLGLVAHRQQRADQRGQWQLAAAGEGSGEVGMSRELREVVRGDSVRQLKCQGLYKVTVFVFLIRKEPKPTAPSGTATMRQGQNSSGFPAKIGAVLAVQTFGPGRLARALYLA